MDMDKNKKIKNTKKNLKVLAVIPARIDSKRVPHKMLKDICGKTLIHRTYERTIESKLIDKVVIATDADEIEDEAKSFGATVIRSIAEHANGTERVAEAAGLFTEFDSDLIVIVWGDEPTYPASVLDDCIEMFLQNQTFDVVIPSFKIKTQEEIEGNSVSKVVTDVSGRILYISRSIIPHNFTGIDIDYYSASGAMVMRPEFLSVYMSFPRVGLEAAEDTEQLRLIENGYSVGTIKTEYQNRGVNTPEDFDAVIKIYREREN